MRNFLLLFVLITFIACHEHDDTAEENITKIQLTISGTGFNKVFNWSDTDGDQIPNFIDTIVLPPNVADLKCIINVLDESETPAIDLTQEIKSESNDHLFIYKTTGANLNISYDDVDGNGLSFGLQTKWKTNTVSTGTVNIKLYHEPTDKTNFQNPGGEVDFNVDFPVIVE